jgi:hypothetical protein
MQPTRIQHDISERNTRFFEAEADKLDGWADDLKLGMERDNKELDRQDKDARCAAPVALTLDDKLATQKQIRLLGGRRNQKLRTLFDAQDKVDAQRATRCTDRGDRRGSATMRAQRKIVQCAMATRMSRPRRNRGHRFAALANLPQENIATRSNVVDTGEGARPDMGQTIEVL